MQLSKGVLKFQIRKAQQGDEHSIAKVHIQTWKETYQSLVPKDYLDNLPSELPVRVEICERALQIPTEILGLHLFKSKS